MWRLLAGANINENCCHLAVCGYVETQKNSLPVRQSGRPGKLHVGAGREGYLTLFCQQVLQGLDLQAQALVLGLQLGDAGLQLFGAGGWRGFC